MTIAAPIELTLIGFGAIGQSLMARLAGMPGVRVTHVVVRTARVVETQAALDALARGKRQTSPASTASHAPPARAVDQVPAGAKLALECAGHEALSGHVVPALQAGCECAVLSVGALSAPGLPEQLEDAARRGQTQVHLLSGAIGGIDALSAARLAGLSEVTYTGRKPPSAWALQGTDARPPHSAVTQTHETLVLEASAREAARLYPKNANVAATVALAGLGLDATKVRLIADPAITENVHEIHARGAFGEMTLQMRGKPLAENPKTSALTVLSALRFLHNRASAMTL
jgi:aspartate dehydrogenase